MSLIYNSYRHDSKLLLLLLKKYNRGGDVFNIIKDELNDGKNNVLDKDLYNIIRNKLGNISFLSEGKDVSTKYEYNRARKRAREIVEISNNNIENIQTYLDIGIGKGIITYTVGKYLKASTYGIDISDERDPSVYKKITFSTYDGINIPYAGFDVITLIMVIHHISDIDSFMNRLYHSLDKGGIVVIRDHDISNSNELRLVKIQHEIMSELYGDTSIYSKDYYEHYYSKNELIELFTKHGLTNLSDESLSKYFNKKYNPTKYCYLVMRKE